MSIDLFDAMRREEEKRNLVRSYQILQFERNPVVPCKGIVARFDARISDVIPIIFLRHLGTSSYIRRENILTVKLQGRLITLYPDGTVSINAVWNERAAKKILNEVKQMINDAYKELLREGPPSEEEVLRASRLGWMDVYDVLPKTNCGECGYETCSAFATDVLRGNAKLSWCTKITKEGSERLRRKFTPRILKALGWTS